MTPQVPFSYDEWLRVGVEAGWVSEPLCAVHGAVYGSEESEEFFGGYDGCAFVLRIDPPPDLPRS